MSSGNLSTQSDPDAWAAAREAWIAGQSSRHTRRSYSAAADAFFGVSDTNPWEVTPGDAVNWQVAMQRQGKAGGTIRARLAALSSFYDAAIEAGLYVGPNPFKSDAVARPKPRARRTTKPLSLESLDLLFEKIDPTTLLGARDRALLLCMLSGYDARLRWDEVRALPPAARQATLEYLRLDRRLEFQSPAGDLLSLDDPVFRPVADHATANLFQFQSRFQSPGGDASYSLSRNRSISRPQVNAILKKLARHAGLPEDSINGRTLRETVAYYYRAPGRKARLDQALGFGRP